ncbi:GTPase HflX [Paenibacillus alkalitolerans]|uniref:GTPase HflX n=1 Tax=Paenibacillus alkalitolerans TaxID=2799335 RepID=UPI0018F698A0|nr:GTPase HflX [Paenibacillus alkalitolerans]
MMEPKQTAVIVGVDLNDEHQFQYSMEELRNLAAACGVETVGEVTQRMNRVNASHYIGTGKVQELSAMLKQHDAQMAIFNDELSPSQIRNLEAALECKVIDRTLLVLDIFAERAKTREAQLQVEIARLQYMLPRLVGLKESLGRQRGGVGTKNRGSGETKLELNRRRIEEKIVALNKELEALVSQRQIQRKRRKRNDVPVVCLVGYTNTGKSTIMNAVLDAFSPSGDKQVFAKDMLFATLETSVRSIELPDRKMFLLTDTVGFISKLPHYLIKAFRSTLEEVSEADLLVHVVDYSNPGYERMIAVTKETLKELGADGIPVVYAYNKAEVRADLELPFVQNNCVYMSAKQHVGIDELAGLIRERIFHDYVQCEMLIPFDQGRLLAYFNNHAQVLATSYVENGTKLTLECKKVDYVKHRKFVVQT